MLSDDANRLANIDEHDVLALSDLELKQWSAYAEQVLVSDIATQHAVDTILGLTEDAEKTLLALEQFVAEQVRILQH